MTVREVPHGSPLYARAVELRRRVLRQPLGLDFSQEELDAEHAQRHFVLLDGDDVIACLSYVPGPAGAKMRQVAVDPDQQGKGFGKRLVLETEKLFSPGEVELHARQTAVPFYQSLGYQVVGERFEEVGLSHFKMRKAV